MNRREFLAAIPAGALMLESNTATTQTTRHTPAPVRLLIGTSGRGSKGIYTASFVDGHLSAPTLAVEAPNPSFLALPSHLAPVLFAVTQPENVNSHASSFRHPPAHEQGSETLQHISDASSDRVGGCHIGVTTDGHAAFIANYRGASVASFHADDAGRLSLASHINFPPDGHGPNPDRQQQSYIHSALSSPDGNFVLVNDLGLDRIHIFQLDRATAKLTPHGEWRAAPGSGPRHLVLHPNGHWIYCIHELDSTVALLDWNASAGTLSTVGAPVSALPAGVSAEGKRGCELALSRDLQFLYASTRVEELFTVFHIDPQSGALTAVQHLPNPGKESRHIALSPDGSYLLSANQFSDEISVFPIDTATGKLHDRSSTVPLGGPSCLLFA